MLARPQLEPIVLRSDDWRSSFEASPFEEPHHEDVAPRTVEYEADRLVRLYLSTSPFGVLPPDEHERVEAELRRLITRSYRLPIGTRLYWTRLA